MLNLPIYETALELWDVATEDFIANKHEPGMSDKTMLDAVMSTTQDQVAALWVSESDAADLLQMLSNFYDEELVASAAK